MIINKWLDWMSENGRSEEIYSEIGKPESNIDKDWIKKVSKSNPVSYTHLTLPTKA